MDTARGIAIALMFLSHTVKGLLSHKMIPDYGVVPIHLLTKLSSSLFILVFGFAVAVVFLPKAGTKRWPAARWGLFKRALVVMFWYKVLIVVQMFERAKPERIIETLTWQRFPDFVEILHFYGWFVLLLVVLLPIWRASPLVVRVLFPVVFGVAGWWLHVSFDFWGIWQLKAVIVEHPKTFCFGILTRGSMALAGLLAGDLLLANRDHRVFRHLTAAICIILGCLFVITFFWVYRDALPATLYDLALNHGKHPPNFPFVTFTFGGALAVLGACLAAPPALLKLGRPFTIVGQESLFCFVFHIVVIFVGYRYLLGLRHDVTYPQALGLTLLVFGSAAAVAAFKTQLKRSMRHAQRAAREQEEREGKARDAQLRELAREWERGTDPVARDPDVGDHEDLSRVRR